MEEECRQNPVMCGKVWHNQGTVFARLFLFREARECFEKAYQYHMNLESIYEAMAACHLLEEEGEVLQLAKKYGIDKQEVIKLQESWENKKTCVKVEEELQAIEELFVDTAEENTAFMQLLRQWKAEYQKHCR